MAYLQQQPLIVFLTGKDEPFTPSSGYTKWCHHLQHTFHVAVQSAHLEDLDPDDLERITLIVIAGPRRPFHQTEIDALHTFRQQGIALLLLLGEGGELDVPTNLNEFLEQAASGLSFAGDRVLRRRWYKNYFHPKQAVITDGSIAGSPFVFPEVSGGSATTERNSNRTPLLKLGTGSPMFVVPDTTAELFASSTERNSNAVPVLTPRNGSPFGIPKVNAEFSSISVEQKANAVRLGTSGNSSPLFVVPEANIEFLYPFGCSIEVERQTNAVPLLTCGSQCDPHQRPICAMSMSDPSNWGSIVCFGSLFAFHDDFLELEQNFALLSGLMTVCLSPAGELRRRFPRMPGAEVIPRRAIRGRWTMRPAFALEDIFAVRTVDEHMERIKCSGDGDLMESLWLEMEIERVARELNVAWNLDEKKPLIVTELEGHLPDLEVRIFDPVVRLPGEPTLPLYDLDEDLVTWEERMKQLASEESSAKHRPRLQQKQRIIQPSSRRPLVCLPNWNRIRTRKPAVQSARRFRLFKRFSSPSHHGRGSPARLSEKKGMANSGQKCPVGAVIQSVFVGGTGTKRTSGFISAE
ncbi:hypothetical protein BV898_19200 [Hypsibius exemplaris]|uniref:IFT52 GIFT domain-containing protein n=1 Tax=Hypsibius exemplaris TaxID=2072580 RepID=A0A9X6NQ86_HYPEX|nr:hypothetical protein BV898_19200 [Hypsibius exemplaris]